MIPPEGSTRSVNDKNKIQTCYSNTQPISNKTNVIGYMLALIISKDGIAGMVINNVKTLGDGFFDIGYNLTKKTKIKYGNIQDTEDSDEVFVIFINNEWNSQEWVRNIIDRENKSLEGLNIEYDSSKDEWIVKFERRGV
jgi:hypothetical protein